MNIEEYDRTSVFVYSSKEEAYDALLKTYDFFQTDSENILMHGTENAYAEVSHHKLTIHYNPDVIPENREWFWELSMQKALQEIDSEGTSFYDVDRMLAGEEEVEVVDAPAEELLKNWGLDEE